MDVTIKTMTIEDIERRRAEIKKIIQTPEFQERVRENALLRRERALLSCTVFSALLGCPGR